MIELIKGLPRRVVGIAVTGRLTIEDCRDVLVPAMKKKLKRHDKIRLYYELSSRFPGASWDDLDLGIEHVSRWERVAIVTDIGWVRLTVKAVRFLIPCEIRVFATVQAEEGRKWIAARPGSQPSVDATVSVRAHLARSRRVRRPSPARAGPRPSSKKEQTAVSGALTSATRPPATEAPHTASSPSKPVEYSIPS